MLCKKENERRQNMKEDKRTEIEYLIIQERKL
jgi:hypothetical protein